MVSTITLGAFLSAVMEISKCTSQSAELTLLRGEMRWPHGTLDAPARFVARRERRKRLGSNLEWYPRQFPARRWREWERVSLCAGNPGCPAQPAGICRDPRDSAAQSHSSRHCKRQKVARRM